MRAAHRRGERLGFEGQLADVLTKPVALRKALPKAEAPSLGRLHHPVAVALLGCEQPARLLRLRLDLQHTHAHTHAQGRSRGTWGCIF